MTFREWFESKWQRRGETSTDALYRASAKTRISYKSLFYAWKGARCAPSTAERIEKWTKGDVAASSLVLLPTRAELRSAEAAA